MISNKRKMLFTEWKISVFAISQILREINFGDWRSAKFAI